jgi:hypothetical protein
MTEPTIRSRRTRALVLTAIITAFYLFATLVVAPLAAGEDAMSRTYPAGVFGLLLFAFSYFVLLKVPRLLGRGRQQ